MRVREVMRMMCIGFNDRGERRICFCFSRQIKGCDDERMRPATEEERKQWKEILEGLIF